MKRIWAESDSADKQKGAKVVEVRDCGDQEGEMGFCEICEQRMLKDCPSLECKCCGNLVHDACYNALWDKCKDCAWRERKNPEGSVDDVQGLQDEIEAENRHEVIMGKCYVCQQFIHGDESYVDCPRCGETVHNDACFERMHGLCDLCYLSMD